MCALMLTGCKSGPIKATEGFYSNLELGKVTEAKEYCTQSTGQLIDLAMSMGGAKPNPDYRMENLRDSIDGNHAWVWFTDANGREQKFELVKIDGDWLVSISK